VFKGLIPVSMQTFNQRAWEVFFRQNCMRACVHCSTWVLGNTLHRSLSRCLCEETWAIWSSCVLSTNTTDESMWSVLCDCKL